MSKNEKINTPNNEKGNIIIPEIKKEIDILPRNLQRRKIEKESLLKKQNLLRERIKAIKRDLQKITSKIISNEKEQESILNTKNSLKTKQNLIINSISDEFYNEFIQKLFNIPEKIREIFLYFINFSEIYQRQLKIIIKNKIELLNLLKGSYSFIKMIRKEKEQKYIELKYKIMNNLKKIKKISEIIFPFNLIINYIQNCILILENKEKIENLQKKEKQLSKIKETSFIKLKILENEKNENDKIIDSINIFNKEATTILEKYKKYIRRNKSITNSKNCIQLSSKKSVVFIPGSDRIKNTTKNINYFLMKTTNEQIDSSNSNLENNRYTNLTSNNNYTNNSNYISGNLTNSDISSLNIDNYQYMSKNLFTNIKKLKNNKLYKGEKYGTNFILKSKENKIDFNKKIDLSENIIKENKNEKNKNESNIMQLNTKNEINISKLSYYNPHLNKIIKKNSMTHLSLTEKYSPVKKFNGKIKNQKYFKVIVTKVLASTNNNTLENNKRKKVKNYIDRMQKELSKNKNIIQNNYTIPLNKEKDKIIKDENIKIYAENIDEIGKISDNINKSVNSQLNTIKNSKKIIYINPRHNKTILSSANLKIENINKSANINLDEEKFNKNDQNMFIKINYKKYPYNAETAKKESINRVASRIISYTKTKGKLTNHEINKASIKEEILKNRGITRINLEYSFYNAKNRFKSPVPKQNKFFRKYNIIPFNNESDNNSKSNRILIKYNKYTSDVINENYNKIELRSKNKNNNLKDKINEFLYLPFYSDEIKNEMNNTIINKPCMSASNPNKIRNKKYIFNI